MQLIETTTFKQITTRKIEEVLLGIQIKII